MVLLSIHNSRENDRDKNETLHYKHLASKTPAGALEENQEDVAGEKFASVEKHPKLRYPPTRLSPEVVQGADRDLSPCISSPGITSSNIISVISERIIFPALQ